MKKQEKSSADIVLRTSDYALRIIKRYRHIQKDDVGRVIGKQLLRSGTSVGANVHEAQGAQSRADFIAKISITHKEILETVYWLHLLTEVNIVPSDRMAELQNKTQQIRKILASILLTTKQNRP